ncbi:MAG: DUF1552 domain-containing protein [Myxococcaceae bacterium]|nr:DUF1552 domain-containing protein [Myxococcaceae bacterium]
MKRLPLSRRTLIKAAGLAFGLPPLEAMLGATSARAATPAPKRLVTLWGGVSIGCDQSTVAANVNIPATVGPNYTPTGGLKELTLQGVQKDVAVLSGLSIPYDTTSPAGRFVTDGDGFHGSTMLPSLAGVKGTNSGNYNTSGKPSADQLFASTVTTATKFKSLVMSAQPQGYGMPLDAGRHFCSWNLQGQNVAAFSQPQTLFTALFGTGAATTDPAAEALRTRRKSILDYAAGQTSRLMSKVGTSDQKLLQQHLDEIRSLEQRIAMIDTSACAQISPPAAVPTSADSKGQESNEELRASLMTDLLVHAFKCDYSRAASFMLTWMQCFMGGQRVAGDGLDLHQMGHNLGDWTRIGAVVGFHVRHFARLVSALKATPDVDGKTMLDNSAVVLLFDAGHGLDHFTGKQNQTHSSDNMIALIAGKSNGLRTDKGHVVATGRHPGQVTLSAMRSLGFTGALGELTSPVAELMV